MLTLSSFMIKKCLFFNVFYIFHDFLMNFGELISRPYLKENCYGIHL
jgi:hypothetical protein